jgi:hypothetical protein
MYNLLTQREGSNLRMITADYIIGLTDGEGCFYINVRPPDKRYLGSKTGIETHFYIKLREDDLLLLKQVKNFFKCGAVYYQKEKRKNHSPCYRFEINSQRDIREVLIPFFDKHQLKSKKKKNYLIFRKVVMIIRNSNYKEDGSLRKIQKLKSQMNS